MPYQDVRSAGQHNLMLDDIRAAGFNMLRAGSEVAEDYFANVKRRAMNPMKATASALMDSLPKVEYDGDKWSASNLGFGLGAMNVPMNAAKSMVNQALPLETMPDASRRDFMKKAGGGAAAIGLMSMQPNILKGIMDGAGAVTPVASNTIKAAAPKAAAAATRVMMNQPTMSFVSSLRAYPGLAAVYASKGMKGVQTHMEDVTKQMDDLYAKQEAVSHKDPEWMDIQHELDDLNMQRPNYVSDADSGFDFLTHSKTGIDDSKVKEFMSNTKNKRDLDDNLYEFTDTISRTVEDMDSFYKAGNDYDSYIEDLLIDNLPQVSKQAYGKALRELSDEASSKGLSEEFIDDIGRALNDEGSYDKYLKQIDRNMSEYGLEYYF